MNNLFSKLQIVIILVLLVFGGWNYYRKNVYYDALHLVAADQVQAAREAEQEQRNVLSQQAKDLQTKYKVINDELQSQLAEIDNHPPTERVVYKLRDRWLPTTCPAEAGSGSIATQIGGLSAEDERFLVRFAADADRNTEQLNACIKAWDTVQEK